MADNTEDEELEKWLEEVFAAAEEVYMEMITEYMAQATSDALSSGGELYETLKGLAIAGAAAWYGMYTPEVYQRSYSMTNPANIVIESSVGINNGTVSGGFSISNISPNAKYAEGFWFYKRGQLYYRPGADLMQFIPEDLDYDVVITQDVADDFFGAALAAVL